MDSPVCAACGQPVADAAASPALSLFFRGRRWMFCGTPCRLDFKRDPAHFYDTHPERGLAPEGAAAPVPRVSRVSPFAGLLGRGASEQGET